MSKDPRAKMTEAEVTAEIIAALTKAKYVTPKQALAGTCSGVRAGFMLQSTKVRPAHGRGTGGDNGLPDLWVYQVRTKRWFGFEIKRPLAHRTKVYPEQQLLVAFEATHIVTSAAEVMALLGDTDSA